MSVIWLRQLLLRLSGHWYYSTSCLHGHHKHCQATVAIDGTVKEPGQCKWCDQMCICRCHRPRRRPWSETTVNLPAADAQ